MTAWVNGDLADLGEAAGVLGQVREGDLRLDIGAVPLVDLGVVGVGVAGEDSELARGAALQPGEGDGVGRDDAAFSAGLDGHVAHGEAAGHLQVLDDRTGELHGAVAGAVHADLADGVEDEVLAADPRAQGRR